MLVVIVTGGNRARTEVTARAQRDNTPTAKTGNIEPGQHGRIASATVQPHGASRPGDTIRNGNNGGAWRNSRNGRNVGADVILTGVGLLPALAALRP